MLRHTKVPINPATFNSCPATAKEGKTLADSFASFENRTKEHTELSVLGGVLKTCHEFQTTIQDMENRLNGQLSKDVAEPLNAGAFFTGRAGRFLAQTD